MRTQLPDWAQTTIGIALLTACAVFVVLSLHAAVVSRKSLKLRVGNAVGYLGMSMWFAAFGLGLAFRVDFMPTLMAVFITGMVAVAVGGTMGGWKRDGVM